MRYLPIAERFAEKHAVNKDTNCWEWTGSRVTGGYGMLGGERGSRGVLAHRFSYEHHVGPVPDEMIVRHRCHNPSCVNPEHLALGTHAENMADMARAGRRIGRNVGTLLPEHDLNRLVSLLNAGATQQSAADAIGIHRTTVQRILARGDLETGAHHKRVFLSDEQRADARRRLVSGERVSSIAQIFGVDRKTIRNLRPDDMPPLPRGRPKKD
jgi:hypothetical protein